ncbi:MAG: NnrU family protein [Steroidobacteraceae bacterium]
MPDLIAASGYFLLIHFGVSGTRLRDVLIARLGSGLYRGAFVLATLVGLVWMIYAYRHAPALPLWGLLLGFRPAAYVLVFIACLFVVIGFSSARCSCSPWAGRRRLTRNAGALTESHGRSLWPRRPVSRLRRLPPDGTGLRPPCGRSASGE